MTPRTACRPRPLAHGTVARVERCEECGCISVHLGPTTVRLCSGSLRSLAATLSDAVDSLDQAAEPPWALDARPSRGSA
jgi:hypothetical protein